MTFRILPALLILLAALPLPAQVPPPPAASVAEVQAGVVQNKFVSPYTLAQSGLGASSNTNALTVSQSNQLFFAASTTGNNAFSGSNNFSGPLIVSGGPGNVVTNDYRAALTVAPGTTATNGLNLADVTVQSGGTGENLLNLFSAAHTPEFSVDANGNVTNAGNWVVNGTVNAAGVNAGQLTPTNVAYLVNAWSGPTNTLALAGNYWFYTATNNCSLTGATGEVSGQMITSWLDISNAAAGAVTVFCSGFSALGGLVTTNQVTLPAHKVGHFRVYSQGLGYTNLMNFADQ